MAASDNMQSNQFGGDVYKAERMALLYQRSLSKTPVSAVANASSNDKEEQR